jgi:hypothetical protein
MATMQNRIEFFVYLIGIVLFGIFYASFKTYFGSGIWLAVVAIKYFLILRAIGLGLKKARHRGQTLPAGH